jgi:hypothetical protein
MRLAIIGSRVFTDYGYLESKLEGMEKIVTCVVSGGAMGADFLGEKWAKSKGIETKIIYPDWKKWGKRAGFLRNEDIIKESDVVVAFWDGESKGTKNSIIIAESSNKEVIVYNFKENEDYPKMSNINSILNWDLHQKINIKDNVIYLDELDIEPNLLRAKAIKNLLKEIKLKNMKKVKFTVEIGRSDLEKMRTFIKEKCEDCYILGYHPDRIIPENVMVSLSGSWSDYDLINSLYEKREIKIHSSVLTEEPPKTMDFDVFESLLDSLRKIEMSDIRANPLMQMCSILFDQIYGKDSIHLIVAHVLMEDKKNVLDEESKKIFEDDLSLWKFMERGN